jgi:hypothetical protein
MGRLRPLQYVFHRHFTLELLVEFPRFSQHFAGWSFPPQAGFNQPQRLLLLAAPVLS